MVDDVFDVVDASDVVGGMYGRCARLENFTSVSSEVVASSVELSPSLGSAESTEPGSEASLVAGASPPGPEGLDADVPVVDEDEVRVVVVEDTTMVEVGDGFIVPDSVVVVVRLVVIGVVETTVVGGDVVGGRVVAGGTSIMIVVEPHVSLHA